MNLEILRWVFLSVFAVMCLVFTCCLLLVFFPEVTRPFSAEPEYEKVVLLKLAEDFHDASGIPTTVAIDLIKTHPPAPSPVAGPAPENQQWDKGLEFFRQKGTARSIQLAKAVWYKKGHVAAFNFYSEAPGDPNLLLKQALLEKRLVPVVPNTVIQVRLFGSMPKGMSAMIDQFSVNVDFHWQTLHKLHWYSKEKPVETVISYREFQKLFTLWKQGYMPPSVKEAEDALRKAVLADEVSVAHRVFLERTKVWFLPLSLLIAVCSPVALYVFFCDYCRRFTDYEIFPAFWDFVKCRDLKTLEKATWQRIRLAQQERVREREQANAESRRRQRGLELDERLSALAAYFPAESHTGRSIAATLERGTLAEKSRLIATLDQYLLQTKFSRPKASDEPVRLKLVEPRMRPPNKSKPVVKADNGAHLLENESPAVRHLNLRLLVWQKLQVDDVLPPDTDVLMAKTILGMLVNIGPSGRLQLHHRRRATLYSKVRAYYEKELNLPFDEAVYLEVSERLLREGVLVTMDDHVKQGSFVLNLRGEPRRTERGDKIVARLVSMSHELKEVV